MKYIFSLVALIAILFHSGAYTAVFVTFQLNQDYIVANKCVNRTKPELQCEGKCYLKKQLTQQTERNTETGMLTVQENIAWLSESAQEDILLEVVVAQKSTVNYYQSLTTQYSAVPRPQPPCLA